VIIRIQGQVVRGILIRSGRVNSRVKVESKPESFLVKNTDIVDGPPPPWEADEEKLVELTDSEDHRAKLRREEHDKLDLRDYSGQQIRVGLQAKIRFTECPMAGRIGRVIDLYQNAVILRVPPASREEIRKVLNPFVLDPMELEVVL